jgi:hypothetical protein
LVGPENYCKIPTLYEILHRASDLRALGDKATKLGFHKLEEFIDLLRDYELITKVFVPWS